MRFQQINVEGFGTLSQCQISGLSSGLSVIYGVNGSGKTTLMRFLSGVLCGFDSARTARLLPPLKLGNPGGSITLQTGAGRFELIRHSRPDQTDTLAISLLQGTADDVSDLRKRLKDLPEKLVSTLYAVSGYAAHDLMGLVQFAQAVGIELNSRSCSGAWLSTKVRDMEAERAELFRTAPTQGALVTLEQRREQLKQELAAARETQMQQLHDWQQSLQTLRQQVEQLFVLGIWQDQELHAVECDLTETRDRLWSTRETKVQDVETVQRPAPLVEAEWVTRLTAIDQEIAHVQQVLRDLAASRLTLSVSKADLAGTEIPDLDTVLQRQRASLARIESQADELTAVSARLQQTSTCICGPQSETFTAGLASIREQVWLICQELGRQQAAHQQGLLQTQREGVDRCEHELVHQIQRLRIRRDEVLRQRSRTSADRIHYRTRHEAAGCQCEGHETAASQWSLPMEEIPATQQVIVRERTVVTSAARPGDSALEMKLLARCKELREQRSNTTVQLHRARREIEQLEAAAKEFAGDQAVLTLQNEHALIEQQLSDAREQWQSLTLLQTVLLRTQQKLNAEAISPVIVEASALLERMTAGRYPRMRWNQDTGELLVINSADCGLPAQALSRGTLEQAVLCFRLALCRDFQKRGIELPLILDDVLSDSDEDRLKSAADVLVDFAQTHQMIFLTCQEHLVDLFAARQAAVIVLPGSPSRLRKPAMETFSPAAPATDSTAILRPMVEERMEAAMDFAHDRVQPDQPYWMQTASPISHVPSLGEQMARRLGALGVRNVGELVELDPETSEMPLDSLQISAATLRRWQAEARLLCCVPNLTGRDAQLLVVCGIESPAELAECDPNTIINRIARIRAQESGDYETQWLRQTPDWPSHSQVERWVRSGRSARSWRSARDWSDGRRIHLRHSARSRRRTLPQVTVNESRDTLPQVRLHSQFKQESPETSLKFYLQLESPVVDAPSIGPRTAERLNAIGIEWVSQLLAQAPADIARRLNHKDFTAAIVQSWQQQCRLMCSVPQLRGHDVQVLVTCNITDPETLAAMTPAKLFAKVEPFVTSREGLRLLRSARVPDLAEVTDWINFARQSPQLRAA